MVEYLNISVSLPVKKNFENRLTFGEVMGKSLVSCFLRHSVVAGVVVARAAAVPVATEAVVHLLLLLLLLLNEEIKVA